MTPSRRSLSVVLVALPLAGVVVLPLLPSEPSPEATQRPASSRISPRAKATRRPRRITRPVAVSLPEVTPARNWIDSEIVAHHHSLGIVEMTAAPRAVSSSEETTPPWATPRLLQWCSARSRVATASPSSIRSRSKPMYV